MKVFRTLVGVAVMLALIGGTAMAQKKPAPKTQPPKPKTGILGTTQLAGDNGKIGVTYSIGPKDQQLNLTLESAQFALRFPTVIEGMGSIVAEPGQRVLLLTFTVQNPLPKEQNFSYDSFHYTVVSPDDQNFEYSGSPVHPERKNVGDSLLKPGQKVRFMVPIRIHPKGPVNKLMVQRFDSTPVLRYDLRGVVKPLTGPFAADKGETALVEGTAKLGESFEFGPYDVTIEAPVALAEKQMLENSADENSTLYALPLTIKNTTLVKHLVDSGIFLLSAKNADGEKIEIGVGMFANAATRYVTGEIDPGQAMRVRLIGPMPTGFKPTEISLQIPEGRTVWVKLP